MLTVKMTLWQRCERLGKRLESAWGVLLPCVFMPLIILLDLSFSQWRTMIVMALLVTIAMLFNPRSRHYLLLPSCLALTGVIAAISVNFGML